MTTSFHWKEWFGSIVLVKPAIFLYWSACKKPGNWTVYIYIYIYIYSKTTGKEYAMFSNVNYKYLMWFTSLTVTSAGRNAWEKVSNHSTKEWMDTEMTLRKRRSCPWVNTLCRRDTHWMTLTDPNLYHIKRQFLDPRVTNITSGRHKQKGPNLLFFNFLTSACP